VDSVKVWLLVLAVLGLPFAYQALGEWRDRRRYPPPGRIVNGLHLWEAGRSGPCVILESGISGTSLSWEPVQDRAAAFARVLSYDRAGLGWSQPPTQSRSLDHLVAELRAALQSANIPTPFILVGHSFGGLIVKHFAAQHPSEVKALVLVDPVPIKDWYPLTSQQAARLSLGVKLSRRGAWLARAGVVRLALDLLLSGSGAIPRLMARATAGHGASVTSRLTGEVRKLPKELWPMVCAHWSLPKSFRAMAGYLEALPANAASVQIPAAIPTIVLTPPNPNCEIPEGAIHRIAPNSGHWIQLDEPDLVVQAIRDLQQTKLAG
jgi:pimeloyl-ACP methyl ester carboxylesterase